MQWGNSCRLDLGAEYAWIIEILTHGPKRTTSQFLLWTKCLTGYRKEVVLFFRWVLQLQSNIYCVGRPRETTFTCPYGTLAIKRMPFGLCNAQTTFQCFMLSIFMDMVKDSMEVFMYDFLVVGDTFEE